MDYAIEERQHLDAEVKRQQAVRRNHDHDAKQPEERQHEELALEQAVVLEVLARVEERHA